jgi:hypothetical protein
MRGWHRNTSSWREREEDTEVWKEKRTGEAPTPRENPLW